MIEKSKKNSEESVTKPQRGAVKKERAKKFTPQQIDFALRYYLNTSSTFGNAYQSAVKAGYSPNYAKNITCDNQGITWVEKILVEILGKSCSKENMVEKAKKVLDKSLDSEDEKLAQDTAKFIAKTTTEFSEKQDITSGGESIAPVALVEFVNGKPKTKSKRKTA